MSTKDLRDEVDVSLADTFPASDPPAWGGGITGVRDAQPVEEETPEMEEQKVQPQR